MARCTNNTELQHLYDELSRTTVISEDFKDLIIIWTHKSIEWALEDKDRKIKAARKLSKKTYKPGWIGLDPNDPIPRSEGI